MEQSDLITSPAPRQARRASPKLATGPSYFGDSYRPLAETELASMRANLEVALQQQPLIEAGAAAEALGARRARG